MKVKRHASYLLIVAANSKLANGAFSTAVGSAKLAPSCGADVKERPLLHKFGRGIKKRIFHSEQGTNRCGEVGAYTSDETIPCLDMQCTPNSSSNGDTKSIGVSSRRAIRKAFTESSQIHSTNNSNIGNAQQQLPLPHGRSSGSGCTIIRLTGSDAASIHGLTKYSNRFFEQVDDDNSSDRIKDTGVFRIDNHVYAGFDDNVNDEGKMQFLDTRILPNPDIDIDPLLLPMEVGELVGTKSLSDAHKGMDTLLDIGTQITSAVLDMDSLSAEKLIDDGSHTQHRNGCDKNTEQSMAAGDVSNSYHRIIRYLKPQKSSDGAAFQPHVDSSFLTLIPVPELPGLEVWCPASSAYNSEGDEENGTPHARGEWVRPAIPFDCSPVEENGHTAYVIAMAGEFLQLTSNGEVPVCIHRVIPPKPPVISTNKLDGNQSSNVGKYKPRVSSPMFLRPRRGQDALLDVSEDLKLVDKESQLQSTSGNIPGKEALYFEKGLIDECNEMHLWSAHDIMKRK